MSPGASFPPLDDGLALHARLFAGDPTGPSDLAAAFLQPLIAWLGEHNRVDPHMIAEAAEEAVLSLIKSPDSFRPGADLAAYLRMAAQADLRNLLEREGRHHRGREPWAAVELSEDRRNNLGRDEDPSLALRVKEQDEGLSASIPPAVREGLTEGEVRVLELMLRKERRTRQYAEVCGVAHLPAGEQRKVIKRVKDKLKKRLERAGGGDEPAA
jgi:DNA-directed RNA polymerase specialized sigma24 family protein